MLTLSLFIHHQLLFSDGVFMAMPSKVRGMLSHAVCFGSLFSCGAVGLSDVNGFHGSAVAVCL